MYLKLVKYSISKPTQNLVFVNAKKENISSALFIKNTLEKTVIRHCQSLKIFGLSFLEYTGS